jgi:uncharacterized membrane protein YphA (DoxX/SURF4 family)
MSAWQIALSFACGSLLAVAGQLHLRRPATIWHQRLMVAIPIIGALAMIGVLGIVLVEHGSTPALRALFRLGKSSVLVVAGFITTNALCSWLLARRFEYSNAAMWATRVLMSSYYAVTGAYALIRPDQSYRFFQESGYSYAFFLFIAIAECAGALGLLLKRTVRLAALGLSIDMVGAVYTHYHNYLVRGTPSPLSNSIDPLKMLPLLVLIMVLAGRRDTSPALRHPLEP